MNRPNAIQVELSRDAVPGENLVANRYHLVQLLHGAGESEVYLAQDTLRLTKVAVKLLPASADLSEIRAEVSALRLLHVPGVARFLDEGVHEARPFVVMDVAPGAPFPGAVALQDWASLEQRVIALVEIVSRIHNRGVIHRDLKPDNVLVDEYGNPCVLDFGYSTGAAIGSGHGVDAGAVGTPAYASPEQLLGKPVDARADLFALGAMIFEVVAGHAPEDCSDPVAFLDARIHEPATVLKSVRSDCPQHVSDLVELLLQRDPEHRPRSAMDVLAALRKEATGSGEVQVPWLGSCADLDQAYRSTLAQGRLEITGHKGSGKTRLLQELGSRFEEEGGSWVSLDARGAAHKLNSDCLDLNNTHGKNGAQSSHGVFKGSLFDALVAPKVLVTVDDWDDWDLQARESFQQQVVAAEGELSATVVASRQGSGLAKPCFRLHLRNLDSSDLKPLFRGPERLFHLQSDCAAELFERTLGNPGRIQKELETWVRSGLARWSGDQIVMDRKALGSLHVGAEASLSLDSSLPTTDALSSELSSLLVWVYLAGKAASAELLADCLGVELAQVHLRREALIRCGALGDQEGDGMSLLVMPRQLGVWTDKMRRDAHGVLASHLPHGSPLRLQQLISACRWSDVVDEALGVAVDFADAGRLNDAEAALVLGLAGARVGMKPDGELLLLEQWTMVALAIFTPIAIDRMLYELTRMHARCPDFRSEILHLESLGQAALGILAGGDANGLEAVLSVPVFSNPNMERWRLALCVQGARSASEAEEEALLANIAEVLGPDSPAALQASFSEWMGRLSYRKNDPLLAAEYFGRARRAAPTQSQCLSALLNGASALLDADKPKEAASLAEDARKIARDCRHTLFEVRSEWVLRTASYRMENMPEVDLDLVDAAGRIGLADQEALVCLTEASIAWRSESPLAAALAHRAASIWQDHGKVWGAVLAQSLQAASCLTPPHLPWLRSVLLELGASSLDCPDLYIGAQGLALVGRSYDGQIQELAIGARTMAARIREDEQRPADHFGFQSRREVLSTEEILLSLDHMAKQT
jgi:serine/threonine protein kinase